MNPAVRLSLVFYPALRRYSARGNHSGAALVALVSFSNLGGSFSSLIGIKQALVAKPL
jgi:hypothetical protein